MRILQVEDYPAHIGLVGDVVRIHFHCHGKLQLLGDEKRLAGRAGDHCLSNGDVESGKNSFGFHCRQYIAMLLHCPFDNHPGAFQIRFEMMRHPPRHLP